MINYNIIRVKPSVESDWRMRMLANERLIDMMKQYEITEEDLLGSTLSAHIIDKALHSPTSANLDTFMRLETFIHDQAAKIVGTDHDKSHDNVDDND